MENKREFLGKVCNIYLIAMFAVLPLYTGGTYWHLGDTKYLLFRNVTIICLSLFLFVELFAGLLMFLGTESGRKGKLGSGISMVDISVFCYGVCAVVSFCFSPYGGTAWTGYRDWYMGTLTRLLLVGVYFLVSRSYDRSPLPVYGAEAALLAVTVIGFFQRLKIDPLKLHAPFRLGDWEYSHMLSTIGNINWLCGYCSVALAFSVTGFVCGRTGIKMSLLYGVSVLSMLLLCIQGSGGGVLVVFVCLGCCLAGGLRKTEYFRRGLLLAAGIALLMPVLSLLISWRDAAAALPSDSNLYETIFWKGWLPSGLMLLFAYVLLRKLPYRVSGLLVKILLALGTVTVLIGGVYVLSRMQWGDDWGSGRGALWRFSWEGFREGSWRQKLVGAGPDCFAEYIYENFPARRVITPNGHWKGAVFANAHNEWLNHLINMGLLGVCSYLAVFVTALRRYWRMPLGKFTLFMYGALSLISFQQVMSTPLLFMVLGICENRLRGERAEVK